MASNASADLLWEILRNNSSFIVKRKVGNNNITFSRDPLNLTNEYTRKHSGTINDKSIGIRPGEKGGIVILTKKTRPELANKPASLINQIETGPYKSTRKTAASVVGFTAKRYYRPDLRKHAVARVSAIKRSQRPVKERPANKPRGKKAKAKAAKPAAANA